MAKVTIYLPDELAEQVRAAKLSVSPICQAALREELHQAALKEELRRMELRGVDINAMRSTPSRVSPSGEDRPEGSPPLGETYRDWRDFTNRVCRPLIEADGNDERLERWHMALLAETDPYYIATALVIADNRIRAIEGKTPQ